jgi:hypothetical protein
VGTTINIDGKEIYITRAMVDVDIDAVHKLLINREGGEGSFVKDLKRLPKGSHAIWEKRSTPFSLYKLIDACIALGAHIPLMRVRPTLICHCLHAFARRAFARRSFVTSFMGLPDARSPDARSPDAHLSLPSCVHPTRVRPTRFARRAFARRASPDARSPDARSPDARSPDARRAFARRAFARRAFARFAFAQRHLPNHFRLSHIRCGVHHLRGWPEKQIE